MPAHKPDSREAIRGETSHGWRVESCRRARERRANAVRSTGFFRIRWIVKGLSEQPLNTFTGDNRIIF
ncbi:hypothetical protein TUM12370_34210 [Salmonella enterica subsp. enterica serovar Choleraesuis]|nr:hypothetical protein TUM12370_34210 [Salmonella enterica subsp. enterica serovar Choleraesuis]